MKLVGETGRDRAADRRPAAPVAAPGGVPAPGGASARPGQLVLHTPRRPDRLQADREFLPAALSMIETPASPVQVALIYVFCGMFSIALAWSFFGHLDVYATVPGKIQAAGRTKTVQPLVAGQVIAPPAKDGDHVAEGDVLIQLDPTDVLASQTAAAANLGGLRAHVARRKAEADAARAETIAMQPAIAWPPEVDQPTREREELAMAADLGKLAASLADLQAQRRQKISARDKYAASIVVQSEQLAVTRELAKMFETLLKTGSTTRAHYLEQQQVFLQTKSALATLEGDLSDAVAEIAVLDAQIVLARESFVSSNVDAYVLAVAQADAAAQDVVKAAAKVRNMTLRAPVGGTVQASAVTTVGQVVAPGQQVMEVVPDGLPLEIEVYILNTDVGFVRVGQEAIVKVDTFPYTRYGTLAGAVVKIANDAIPGKQGQQQQKNASQPPSLDGAMSITTAAQSNQDLVFPAIVRLAQTSMAIDGRQIPLSAGMTVTVEIKTESRRAITYILSPLANVFSTAAHER